MGSNQLDVQWTNAILLDVVEKSIVRSKFSRFSDKDNFGDLKARNVFNSKFAIKTIKKLFENNDGKLDLYGPPEQFMKDLVTLQYFPNNAKFLGLSDEYNYLGYPRFLVDKFGREHMSKMDVFMFIYRNHTNAYEDGDEIATLGLMKMGNKIGNKLKTTFEIIPCALVDAIVSACSDFYRKTAPQVATRFLNDNFHYSKYTVDELYWRFYKHFDESTEAHLLKQLKQQLILCNKRIPIKLNTHFYDTVYMKFGLFIESTQVLIKQFPVVFEPNVPCFGDKHIPVTRMFKDGDNLFFFAKELRAALICAFREKYPKKIVPSDMISIETDDQRTSNGIINSVSFDDFEKILKKFNLTFRDLHLIENAYKRTSRQIAVPLISPYGTHCKLATDAFFEIFDHVSTGLRLFQGVKKENLSAVYSFFNNLPFINVTNSPYLVSTSTIDECVDKVYNELQNFVTEPIYEIPRKSVYSQEDALNEINKLSPNFPLNQDNLQFMIFQQIKKVGKHLTIRDLYEIYDHCLILEILANNETFSLFMHNQGACKTMKRFVCACIKQKETSKNTPKSIGMLTILNADYSNAIHTKYNDTVCYSLETSVGLKFYDNETILQQTLDASLSSVTRENRELISLVYKAQNINHESTTRSTFYLNEVEAKELIASLSQRFADGIRCSNYRLENQKEDLHQTGVNRWEGIWKNMHDFFPEETKYQELFEKMKTNLKSRTYAKSMGIQGSFMNPILDILRHAQMNYGRIWSTVNNLTDYCSRLPGRKIVLRLLTSKRVGDLKTWHLFADEVLEAVQCVLRQEKRLHFAKETIEQWEMEWHDSETHPIIEFDKFEKILEILHIDKSHFFLVPDILVTKSFVELPLKMSYDCVVVQAPDGTMVCHWMQAQYLMFQKLAGPINWRAEDSKCSNHKGSTLNLSNARLELLAEMEKVKTGYVSVEKVEVLIKKFIEDKQIYHFAKKINMLTPFTLCHILPFNDFMPRSVFVDILQALTNESGDETSGEFVCLASKLFEWLGYKNNDPHKLKEIEIWKVRYAFMNLWIDWFFESMENEHRKNLLEAWTVTLPFVKIPNLKALKQWEDHVMKGRNCFVDYSKMKECAEKMEKSQRKNSLFKWNQLFENTSEIEVEKPEKCTTPVMTTKKVDQDFSTMKKGFLIKKAVIVEHASKTAEEVLTKLTEHFARVLPFIDDTVFEKIKKLEELIKINLKGIFDDQDFDCFGKIMEKSKEVAKLEEKLGIFLDFRVNEDGHFYRKKKRGGLAKEEKPVKCVEKQPKKDVKKVVTETKIVESCEKCVEMNNISLQSSRKIADLEKSLEEIRKTSNEQEAEIGVLKSQISENKKKYRLEIQKYKEDSTEHENRVQQLQQELKESREDLKLEREKMYTDVEESSKAASESVRKMKIELENAKFVQNANSKKIEQLTEENRHLSNSIEILQEEASAKKEEKTGEVEENNKDLEKDTEKLKTLNKDLEKETEKQTETIRNLEKRILELEEENLQNSQKHNDEIQDMILYVSSLEFRISEIDENFFCVEDTSESDNSVESECLNESPEIKERMNEMKRMLNVLNFEEVKERVDEITELFSALCTSTSYSKRCENDAIGFSEKLKVYIEHLREQYDFLKNHKIEKEDLDELPQLPSPFSMEFIAHYEKLMKKEDCDVENLEKRCLRDHECFICAIDMDLGQIVSKCAKCCKHFHTECVSEMMKLNANCPICQSSLKNAIKIPLY